MGKNIIKNIIKSLFFTFLGLTFFLTLSLMAFKMYIVRTKDDLIELNLNSLKSGASSQIYFKDKNGQFNEYQKISNGINRIWVDFSKIPQHMKDIILAIEDKRFYKHGGVDFFRTTGATFKALTGHPGYGGSTITQQLVKNLTEDNKFTFTRKIREIGRAFILEDKLSKDEILEAYLNIVNFGAGNYGVGAAAWSYFGKSIDKCNIAECTAIAVITKNPSKYNPFNHPDMNKKRREIFLKELLKQKKIDQSQFEKAMKDSANLKFLKHHENQNKNSSNIRNWYVETLCNEIADDLSKKYEIKREIAEQIVYTGGLKIYSSVDPVAQEIAEQALINCAPGDSNLELGYTMIDYNGKILAILGSSKPKSMNRIYNRAISAIRQPGSTMKPISVYGPAIDLNIFNYSSIIEDSPLDLDVDGNGKKRKWPNNWYKSYKGPVTLQWAIEKSANAPVAQVLNTLGLDKSFKFLTEKLCFSHLDSHDSKSYASLATGGTHNGVTPLELAASYQIFGNGGKYNKPSTYFYVTDKNGEIILDNRNLSSKQVIKEDTAYVMNRLLRQVIVGKEGTGRMAYIDNWDIVGKTGTTNNNYDSWFVGLNPACVSSIWTGYDKQKTINETGFAIKFWKYIMKNYLEHLNSDREFKEPSSVERHAYCSQTGYLANQNCPHKRLGYYCSSNVPPYCYAHSGDSFNGTSTYEFENSDIKIPEPSENDFFIFDPNLEENFADEFDDFFN